MIQRLLLGIFLSLGLLTFEFVTPPPAMAQGNPNDDRIYDQVRLKLAEDRDVGAYGIDVTVKNGAVTLKGTVAKPVHKTKAEKVAKRVKGVTSVTNELKLRTE